MEIILKQLKENGKVIFPQTSAEAVVVKSKGEVITLDTFINKKTIITVNNKPYINIEGHQNQEIKFGDDFEADEIDNNIKLKWNNL